MDPAFFVGRRAILDWLNKTFETNMSKIEETASGAVACQLLDAIYPGDVNMARVRWDAKSPHEFIDNYKVIQAVFEKKGIDKYLGAWGRRGRRAPPRIVFSLPLTRPPHPRPHARAHPRPVRQTWRS